MADPISAIFIGSAIAGVGSKVYSGYQQNQAAKREASLMEDQGRIEQEEAAAEAQRRADEVRKFSRVQGLSFLKNGVSLAGSPLLVLDETLTQGQQEVDAITRSGDAKRTLYNRKAANTRASGRSALLGGVLEGATSAGTSYAIGKNKGII